MCVCDLAEILDASIATTSHHLRYLKKQGVAKSRKDGKEVYYSLANEEILSTIRIVLDMPNSLSLTSEFGGEYFVTNYFFSDRCVYFDQHRLFIYLTVYCLACLYTI